MQRQSATVINQFVPHPQTAFFRLTKIVAVKDARDTIFQINSYQTSVARIVVENGFGGRNLAENALMPDDFPLQTVGRKGGAMVGLWIVLAIGVLIVLNVRYV